MNQQNLLFWSIYSYWQANCQTGKFFWRSDWTSVWCTCREAKEVWWSAVDLQSCLSNLIRFFTMYLHCHYYQHCHRGKGLAISWWVNLQSCAWRSILCHCRCHYYYHFLYYYHFHQGKGLVINCVNLQSCLLNLIWFWSITITITITIGCHSGRGLMIRCTWICNHVSEIWSSL